MTPHDSAAWLASQYAIKGAHIVPDWVTKLTAAEREVLDHKLEKLDLGLWTTNRGVIVARDPMQAAGVYPTPLTQMQKFVMRLIHGGAPSLWDGRN